MIKFISPRNSALAFAFAGFAGLAMSSFAGQANASIVDECHGNTKGKVVACCKQHIERYGRPLWMSNGEDNNCAAIVTCVGKKRSGGVVLAAVAYVKPRFSCYLEQSPAIEEGSRNLKYHQPTIRQGGGKN